MESRRAVVEIPLQVRASTALTAAVLDLLSGTLLEPRTFWSYDHRLNCAACAKNSWKIVAGHVTMTQPSCVDKFKFT